MKFCSWPYQKNNFGTNNEKIASALRQKLHAFVILKRFCISCIFVRLKCTHQKFILKIFYNYWFEVRTIEADDKNLDQPA